MSKNSFILSNKVFYTYPEIIHTAIHSATLSVQILPTETFEMAPAFLPLTSITQESLAIDKLT